MLFKILGLFLLFSVIAFVLGIIVGAHVSQYRDEKYQRSDYEL